MGVRWIRLDTTWSQSEWLADIPAPSRLAWVELLCFVKSHGVAGSVKRPSNATLSRMWNISRNAIEAMFSAAFQDGAVVMDGPDLLITGWSDRQMDTRAAERMRAYRERLKGRGDDSAPPNVTPVTRNNENSLIARARLTETLTKTNTPSSREPPSTRGPAGVAREDGDDDLEREIQKHLPEARKNVIAIHGDTKADVMIEGYPVGVGVEIDVFKRLCRARRDPPEIIAAAIAHIPLVSDLTPPVSLARWGAPDGMPIYEQCVGRAYKEVSP